MPEPRHLPCLVHEFQDYPTTLAALLDDLGAPGVLKRRRRVIIKPNLVNTSPFPVTTHPEMVRTLVEYARRHSKARIILAEGCGDACLDTGQIFADLGYAALAEELDLELVDLNQAPLTRMTRRKDPTYRFFPEIFLPKAAMSGLLISVAVLKRHSLAQVTLTMKNMLGLLPPSHYQRGGSWKKSALHADMQRSIYELNRYRAPDLAIIDASVGLAEYHLGGATCSPPVNKLVAGFDPVAVDAAGAALLGLDWRSIGHIRMAHGRLGLAEAPVSSSP
ncbi:DUF362 domain-containing protein [Desulfonatronum sp. SC1]|uniref:DUF362 domain-containing protein n=1 Tax=Desulfonatronum sp. SC1 TaxID=2109626 RepID=UPI000D30D439|nr:DUF362 domain-containing protein [Desulfonatronum sp. SC1]PTN38443.1 hypothetical protein C6366_02480 [Desulfonatronum sp. SC1]